MGLITDRMLDAGALGRRLATDPYLRDYSLASRNLLSVNQASLEVDTTGWAAFNANATVARSTAQTYVGSACLAVTCAVAASTGAITASYFEVIPGRAYTAQARFMSATTRTVKVVILWYTSANAYISQSSFPDTTLSASWQVGLITAVAPATAGRAYLQVIASSAQVGEVFYWDAIGFWEGAGGVWVPGGERVDPSTLGFYFDESVGRRQFAWDTVNNRWQLVYGDTGWRVNPGWFGADWNESTLYVRRVNNDISFYGYLTRVTASGAVLSTLAAIPSGWRDYTVGQTDYPASLTAGGTRYMAIENYAGAGANLLSIQPPSGTTFPAAWAAADKLFLPQRWVTNDAWPATNPGSASGSIPFA
jgi:hypothetical protein